MPANVRLAVPSLLVASLLLGASTGRRAQSPPAWPGGARAAVSLSFDDARRSQLTEGVPLLRELGLRATFYLTGSAVAAHGLEWKAAAAAGHELGNHTMTHPCTGHFEWSRAHALEVYTQEAMEAEIVNANRAIAEATGVTPVTFAYPCGQTFFGRGAAATSYIPMVARLFLAGRGYDDGMANDLAMIDPARLLAVGTDDKTLDQLRPLVEQAVAQGRWLVFAGHDIGTTPGPQVTRVDTLRALSAYLKDPVRGVWVGTVAEVAAHLKR